VTDRDRKAIVDLKVRMREPLRAQIEEAARDRGVSMNAEAVDRLERSFDRASEHALDLAYGRPLAAIIELAGRLMLRVGERGAFDSTQRTDRVDDWLSDPYAYNQARDAVVYLLNALKPSGDPSRLATGKDATEHTFRRIFGPEAAYGTLSAIKQGHLVIEGKKRDLPAHLQDLRAKLGPTRPKRRKS
jgi:hypothetical protein